MEVIKRNGKAEEFNLNKIANAINQAFKAEGIDNKELVNDIAQAVLNKVEGHYDKIDVEEIQDIVEAVLVEYNLYSVSKSYILYRQERTELRELKAGLYDHLMTNVETIMMLRNIENANANIDEGSFLGRNHKVTGMVLKEYALDNLISEKVSRNHREGKVYIHDLDNYSTGCPNCLTVDFAELYKGGKGFVTRNGDVREPSNIMSFMQLVAVVFQVQSQCQFGGIASSKLDYDAAPYVHKSFVKNFKDALIDIELMSEEDANTAIDLLGDELRLGATNFGSLQHCLNVAKRRTIRDTKQACESLYHNLNTLESRAGSQVPFSSIVFGTDTSVEGRLVTQCLLESSLDGIGQAHRTSIFPISIFKLKAGVNRYPDDPNYDLYLLAIKSLSRRIYPNIINLDSMLSHEAHTPDEEPSTMGCRTATGFDINGLGNTMTGRGNVAPSTINLVDIGLEYGVVTGKRDVPDLEGFFAELDRRIEDCRDGLLERFEYIASQKASSAYFTYENELFKNTLGRKLRPDEEVRECVKHGTLAIGFIGIAETMYALFKATHTHNKQAYDTAYKIVSRIREKADEYKQEYKLNFSCYATPAEGLCSTLRDKMAAKWGIIEGVTDREFISNSYHIPVYEDISIYNKFKLEAPFTVLCNGGNITYIEVPSSIRKNPRAVEKIIEMGASLGLHYIAINSPIDTCNTCGFQEEIEKDCPICGSSDIERLRRVTGYITKDYHRFNKGKIAETESRVKHAGRLEEFGEED